MSLELHKNHHLFVEPHKKDIKKLSNLELSIPLLPKIEPFVSRTSKYLTKKKIINKK